MSLETSVRKLTAVSATTLRPSDRFGSGTAGMYHSRNRARPVTRSTASDCRSPQHGNATLPAALSHQETNEVQTMARLGALPNYSDRRERRGSIIPARPPEDALDPILESAR